MISVGNAGNDQEYIVRFNGSATNDYRYCDTQAELVYCLNISDYASNWISLAISNNYLVEISDHDGDWMELYNYATISGGAYASNGSNATSLQIIPSRYGFDDVLYIRIRNCYPEKGWGANLSSIGIYYVETN